MNQSEFNQFIKLVEVDKEIYQLSREKANLKTQIENIELDIENIQKDIESLHRTVSSFKKNSSELELELKALDNQFTTKSKKINNASTTREYYSLEQEIEAIKISKDQIEAELFNLWLQLEENQNLYDQTVVNAKDKKENLIKDIKSFEARILYLDKQIAELNEEKQKLEILVKNQTPEIFDHYHSMKENVHNPVVKVKNSNCPVCFYEITPNEIIKIKTNKLTRCQNCYRLLYTPAVDPEF